MTLFTTVKMLMNQRCIQNIYWCMESIKSMILCYTIACIICHVIYMNAKKHINIDLEKDTVCMT